MSVAGALRARLDAAARQAMTGFPAEASDLELAQRLHLPLATQAEALCAVACGLGVRLLGKESERA